MRIRIRIKHVRIILFLPIQIQPLLLKYKIQLNPLLNNCIIFIQNNI
jgi:hypothetical protein